MKQGYFTFVLHSHLPYVRLAGRWPHGEEMLHEAIAETYLPLLRALLDLREAGIPSRLTLGLTPILLEQLADPEVLDHFEMYAAEELEVATADRRRFADDPHLAALADFYVDFYARVLSTFEDRLGRDLVGAFRSLAADGSIDVLTSAATHAYLPLLDRDSSIHCQLRTGVAATTRHLGRTPRGIWLPECAYRPAYRVAPDGPVRRGVEAHLADFGLGYFFTDTHVVEASPLVGKVADDVIGPYGGAPRRHVVTIDDPRPPATDRTALRPYLVRGSDVVVVGRDAATGMQVWAASRGYPGDPWYREFHRKDAGSGLQYWRVTGPDVDLGQKEPYDPAAAAGRVAAHAEHFVALVRARVAAHFAEYGRPGLVVSAYDTELFGHWWFEGVDWLADVLRRLAADEVVGLTTPANYLDAHPPDEVLALPESSWGSGGGHWVWLNPRTEWMWPLIHAAERRMEQLVAAHPAPPPERREILDQCGRELLLLQSSDWPFLISTGQAVDYAARRFQLHLARFNHLAMAAEGGVDRPEMRRFLDAARLADNPFPELDYRWLAAR